LEAIDLLTRYRDHFRPVYLSLHRANHVRIIFKDIIGFGKLLRSEHPDMGSVHDAVVSMQSEARRTHACLWRVHVNQRPLCGHDIDSYQGPADTQDDELTLFSPERVNSVFDEYKLQHERMGVQCPELTILAFDKSGKSIGWLTTNDRLTTESLLDRIGIEEQAD